MRLLVPVVLSLLSLASSASAANLYVATTGDDAASGSRAAPFRTITKAAAATRPGDHVHVRGGTYRERVIVYSKGSASRRVVIQAMEGERVVLDGGDIPADQPIVELTDTAYLDFAGFEIRNSKYIGVVLWRARQTRILRNHIHHTARNGIYAGADERGHSSFITVSGNSVHDTVRENRRETIKGGGWAGAVVVSKTEQATITDNRVWNNDGEGIIVVGSNHALVRYNEIFDNFSVNLYLDNARHVKADRNRIYATGNPRYFRDGKPAAGIAVANETKEQANPSSDNVFTNNVVSGTKFGFSYGSYETGGGLRNTRVLRNTFSSITDEFIRIDDDDHVNSVIADNLFCGGPPAVAGRVPGVIWRNNRTCRQPFTVNR